MTHPIADLPFVKTLGKGKDRNTWNVTPTGDYFDDWRTGERYALEALRYMAADPSPPGSLLGFIATDLQANGGEYSGIELGFFNCIGTFAAFYLRTRGDAFYREYMARGDKLWAEADAKEAQERSDRARKAANARWAKRRPKPEQIGGPA